MKQFEQVSHHRQPSVQTSASLFSPADAPPSPAALPPQSAALHLRPARLRGSCIPQRLPGRAGQPHPRQSSAPHGRLHGLRDLPAAVHRADHTVRKSGFLLVVTPLNLNVTCLPLSMPEQSFQQQGSLSGRRESRSAPRTGAGLVSDQTSGGEAHRGLVATLGRSGAAAACQVGKGIFIRGHHIVRSSLGTVLNQECLD